MNDFVLSRSLFLRLLGLVFAAAFASLAIQAIPLLGERGILPISEFLEFRRGEGETWLAAPSLFWIDASDAAIQGAGAGGIGAGLLLAAGVLPFVWLLTCVVLYRSFCAADVLFLGYQWDELIVEAGWLALFVTPLSLRLSRATRPPHLFGVLLVRFLLFRLMLSSGVV